MFLASTTRPTARYVRLPGLFALHGAVPPELTARVMFRLHDGKIAVCRGEPPAPGELGSPTMTPVYSLQPNGPPAVPTGRLFVRFEDHITAEERHQALRHTGYRIVRLLPYAPHAVWLEALSGNIAVTLKGISALEQLSGVANIEPEMLTSMAQR